MPSPANGHRSHRRGQRTFQPNLTVLFDVYSRAILGHLVLDEPASSLIERELVRRVLDRGEHVPVVVVCDLGRRIA